MSECIVSGFDPLRAAVLGACLLLGACAKNSQQAGSMAGQPLAEVGVYTVKAQALTLKTELPGRATAYTIAEVRPQVGGILKRRVFSEGADVVAGQLLYEIDPALYQAAYGSARAALAKAEATLATTRLKAERYAQLAESGVISKQDNDDLVAALGEAQADVSAAQAAVQTAQINLGYTRISAPISGRIGKSSVTAGALLTANQVTALATIQQLNPIYVDVTQTSTELLRLRRALASGELQQAAAGQASVTLVLDDGSAYGLPGTLQFADISVDEGTSSVILRAAFPNPKAEILPGMYVRAVLEAGTAQQALLLPQQAVTRDPVGNATALVLSAAGVVEQRSLNIDRSVDNQWLIREGIKEGERVIIEGGQKLKAGDQARAGSGAAAATVSATPARP